MNIVLNLCFALLVGNLGFRIWSYFVTMEAIRSVAKDVVKLKERADDSSYCGLQYSASIEKNSISTESLKKSVASLETDVVAKNWELKRRLDEKLTKMETRLTSKKKCSPHKPKEKEEKCTLTRFKCLASLSDHSCDNKRQYAVDNRVEFKNLESKGRQMSDEVKYYDTPVPPHPPKKGYRWSEGENRKGECGWFQEPRVEFLYKMLKAKRL